MIPVFFPMMNQQQQHLENLKKLRQLEAAHHQQQQARNAGAWMSPATAASDIDNLIFETTSALSLPLHHQQQQQQRGNSHRASTITTTSTLFPQSYQMALPNNTSFAAPANCLSLFANTTINKPCSHDKTSPMTATHQAANLMSLMQPSSSLSTSNTNNNNNINNNNNNSAPSNHAALEMLWLQRQQQQQAAIARLAALHWSNNQKSPPTSPLQSSSNSIAPSTKDLTLNESNTTDRSASPLVREPQPQQQQQKQQQQQQRQEQQEKQRQDSYDALRRSTFGNRHEFPMQMTGEGVLDRNEINALNTGFLMLLPSDHEGRSVLSMDMSRIDGCSKASIQRCLFYMFSIMAEEDRRAVLLYRKVSPVWDLGNGDSDSDDGDSNKETKFLCLCNAIEKYLGRLLKVLPLTLDRIHLFGTTTVPSSLSSIRAVIHPDDDDDNTSNAEATLQKQFSLKVWPKYCPGGEWGYAQFFEWQELRTRMEWKVPVGLCGKSAASGRFPAIHSYQVQSGLGPGERKRRLNVIHSRRKRSRDRIEQELVYDQVVELQQAQKKLRQTHEHLQLCVRQACECVRRSTGQTL